VVRLGVILFVVISVFCSSLVHRHQAWHGWEIFHVATITAFLSQSIKFTVADRLATQSCCNSQITQFITVKIIVAIIYLVMSGFFALQLGVSLRYSYCQLELGGGSSTVTDRLCTTLPTHHIWHPVVSISLDSLKSTWLASNW